MKVQRFIRSIRWRLQLWLALLLVLILGGFGVTAYEMYRVNVFHTLDHQLEEYAAILSLNLRIHGGPPSREPPPPPPGREPFAKPPRMDPPPPEFDHKHPEPQISDKMQSLFRDADTNNYYFAVWRMGRDLVQISAHAPTDLTCPEPSSGGIRMHSRTRGSFRETYLFTEMGDGVLVGRSVRDDLEALRSYARRLIVAGLAILVFSVSTGLWLTRRALNPIQEISAAAERISAGNLGERINVADTDSELGQLASVLNDTFARLESLFAQQRQFTADAAHELRTPIAVLLAETQTALRKERSATDYRKTIEACQNTVQHMRRMTEGLLTLARFDGGQAPLQHLPFDWADVVQKSVELVRPVAETKGVRILCDLSSTLVLGDEDRCGVVVNNLLNNAVDYNVRDGEIRVTLCRENGTAILSIANSGQGILPEDLPHIFERFYRGDKSRTGAAAHLGLGLAICKAIVDAHGGAIEALSRPGQDTIFTVRLPIAAG